MIDVIHIVSVTIPDIDVTYISYAIQITDDGKARSFTFFGLSNQKATVDTTIAIVGSIFIYVNTALKSNAQVVKFKSPSKVIMPAIT